MFPNNLTAWTPRRSTHRNKPVTHNFLHNITISESSMYSTSQLLMFLMTVRLCVWILPERSWFRLSSWTLQIHYKDVMDGMFLVWVNKRLFVFWTQPAIVFLIFIAVSTGCSEWNDCPMKAREWDHPEIFLHSFKGSSSVSVEGLLCSNLIFIYARIPERIEELFAM